jgi:hypothetical protein
MTTMEMRRKEHRCLDCGIDLPDDDKRTRCAVHRKAQMEYYATWSKKNRVKQKAERKRRAAAGVCTACGKNVVKGGRRQCTECLTASSDAKLKAMGLEVLVGDDNDGVPVHVERCACGLTRDDAHRVCDLLGSGGRYATARGDAGEATIPIRSKAA